MTILSFYCARRVVKDLFKFLECIPFFCCDITSGSYYTQKRHAIDCMMCWANHVQIWISKLPRIILFRILRNRGTFTSSEYKCKVKKIKTSQCHNWQFLKSSSFPASNQLCWSQRFSLWYHVSVKRFWYTAYNLYSYIHTCYILFNVFLLYLNFRVCKWTEEAL